MIKPVMSYSVSNSRSNVSFNANPIITPVKTAKNVVSTVKPAQKETFLSSIKNILAELFPRFDKEYRNLFNK